MERPIESLTKAGELALPRRNRRGSLVLSVRGGYPWVQTTVDATRLGFAIGRSINAMQIKSKFAVQRRCAAVRNLAVLDGLSIGYGGFSFPSGAATHRPNVRLSKGCLEKRV